MGWPRKRSSPARQDSARRLGLWRLARPWLPLVLVLAGFFGAWYVAWRRLGPELQGSTDYQVTRDRLVVTPRPEWIRRDIAEQVYRDLSLEEPLSILDDQLLERVRHAFALHPWVAKVQRVQRRYPATIVVDLVYRRPVCVVETAGRLVVVDAEAVVLPDEDFSPVDKARYPRLAGIESGPLGPVGTRWGHPRVAGGAEIAAVLLPAWESLGLERIIPSAMPQSASDREQTYELLTRRGTWIFWGKAPSAEGPGEPRAADKLARLQRYLDEHGTLEGTTGPQRLDLTR